MPKATKKTKDPNAPKRNLSAYFMWLKENRERIKEPGMSVADVCKIAGAQWNALQDKSRWQMMAQEDKARYEREKQIYQQQEGQKKKKPLNSFFYYLKENRDRIKQPGMSETEIAQAAGYLWAQEEDKTYWEEQARNVAQG